jgi:hypothetical protein
MIAMVDLAVDLPPGRCDPVAIRTADCDASAPLRRNEGIPLAFGYRQVGRGPSFRSAAAEDPSSGRQQKQALGTTRVQLCQRRHPTATNAADCSGAEVVIAQFGGRVPTGVQSNGLISGLELLINSRRQTRC